MLCCVSRNSIIQEELNLTNEFNENERQLTDRIRRVCRLMGNGGIMGTGVSLGLGSHSDWGLTRTGALTWTGVSLGLGHSRGMGESWGLGLSLGLKLSLRLRHLWGLAGAWSEDMGLTRGCGSWLSWGIVIEFYCVTMHFQFIND